MQLSVNENMSRIGNHNQAYTVRYRQSCIQKIVHPNGLTNSGKNFCLQTLSGDSSNESEKN